MNLKCRFGWHDWNSWSTPVEYVKEYYRSLDKKWIRSEFAYRQERTCNKCNKIEVKFATILK